MSQRTVSILHTCPSSSTGFLHSRSPWIVDIFLLLKLKGGRKRKHYLLIQSCTAVTYFPSAVINSASWNGGWGGRLFDFVIWSCLLRSFHKAATMWSFLCTVTMAIFLMSSTVHLKELNWWPERMRWLKQKKKSFIKMLNWVYQDYLG